jgi:hypothetical protein
MTVFFESSRPRAVAGAVAAGGNILAVVALYQIPSAYRVGRLDDWAAAVSQFPEATAISAAAFTIGLIALAVWAHEVARLANTPLSRVGGHVVAYGALLNAAATLTPLVAAYHVDGSENLALVRALLGFTIALDAAFNATLFAGLICLAVAWPPWRSRYLRGLAVLAGLASLPVAAQAIYDPAASLLAVSGPLWLALVIADSVSAWRRDANAIG